MAPVSKRRRAGWCLPAIIFCCIHRPRTASAFLPPTKSDSVASRGTPALALRANANDGIDDTSSDRSNDDAGGVVPPDDGTILVVGATGGTGFRALGGLCDVGYGPSQIRLLTRNADKPALRPLVDAGFQVCRADLDDGRTDELRKAIEGCVGCYIHSTSADTRQLDTAEVERARTLASALSDSSGSSKSRPPFVVYNSAAGESNHGVRRIQQKHDVERVFLDEFPSIPFVSLRANLFMEELWKDYTRPVILNKGKFPFSAPSDREIYLTSVRDMGRLAGTCISRGLAAAPKDKDSRIINVAGDVLSPSAMSQAFASAQGSPCTHSKGRVLALLSRIFFRDLWEVIRFYRRSTETTDIEQLGDEFPGLLTNFATFLDETRWGDKTLDFDSFTDWSRIRSDASETTGDIVNVDVAIVGGGPTGLSAAIGLLKVSGTDPNNNVVVYEADDLSPKGASVSLSPEGRQALKALDACTASTLRRSGESIASMQNFAFDGSKEHMPMAAKIIFGGMQLGFRAVGSITGRIPGLRYRPGFRLVHAWAFIRETLRRRVEELGGTVKSQHRLASITQDGDHIVLAFQNGARVKANTVLACDGVMSSVRRCLSLSGPDRGSTPDFLVDEMRSVFRGTVPDSKTRGGSSVFYFHWGSKEAQGGDPDSLERGVIAVLFPAGQGLGTTFSITVPKSGPRARSADEARDNLNTILAPLEPIDPLIREIIDESPVILEHKLYVRDFDKEPLGGKVDGEVSGRVAFLGDAAHPLRPTGEGLALSIEDAWTIAKLALEERLESNADGPLLTPEIIRKYYDLRKARVQAVSNAVRKNANSAYVKGESDRGVGVKSAYKENPIELGPL